MIKKVYKKNNNINYLNKLNKKNNIKLINYISE